MFHSASKNSRVNQISNRVGNPMVTVDFARTVLTAKQQMGMRLVPSQSLNLELPVDTGTNSVSCSPCCEGEETNVNAKQWDGASSSVQLVFVVDVKPGTPFFVLRPARSADSVQFYR